MSKKAKDIQDDLSAQHIDDAINQLISIRDGFPNDGIDAVVTQKGPVLVGDAQLSVTSSEARYRHIINRMSALVLELSPAGDVIYLNEAITHITGFSTEALIGHNWLDLLLPVHASTPSHALRQQFFESGELNDFRTSIRTQDGNRKILSWNSAHVHYANGLIERLIYFGTDITEHNLAFEMLRESEELLKGSHIIASLGSYVLDCATGNWRSSEMLDKLFGIDASYDRSIEGWAALIHPDERAVTIDYFRDEVLGKGKVFDKEYRIIRPDNRAERWIRGLGKVEFDAHNHPLKLLGTVQDITEYKLAEIDLRIAATAFESQEGMIITDAEGIILRVNQAFTAITGYSAEEAIGNNPRMLQSGRQDANFFKTMWRSILHKGFWEGEVWNKRKSGEIFPEHLMVTAVKNPQGMTTNYVGTLTDITLSREAANEIQQLAFYDSLTRLPNRRLLVDRLQQALASSARTGKEGALLFLDLDNFKTLNDTLGHDIGDMLLQQVAQRIESCVREGDTVARLGGDEFVVMLKDLSGHALEAATQTEVVGAKILTALSQPYKVSAHTHRCTTSIGATLFGNQQIEVEMLMKQADIAMYEAKKSGRNTLRFFDPEMQTSINANVTLENELHGAVEKQQFQLHYQVQVDSSGRALGAEALIRWSHPQRGMLSPAQFIQKVEETGLILPIGQWVLETACAQLKTWQKDTLTRHLTLSINVSARQFHEAGFVAQVQAALSHHAVNPMLLKLEPTESILLRDIEDAVKTMSALKALGVHFALDDFGTGFSSLQYLKKLPLNQLKIDQSFVRDLVFNNSDQVIVRTIIAMAHSLNLEVIAEGVETAEQLQLLQRDGCNRFQGYLFGRPVPIEQFEKLLK